MYVNYVQLTFCFMTTTVIIWGSLINFLEPILPHFLSRAFRYGKFASKGGKTKLEIEVPKAWFKHFYLLAVFVYTYLLWLIFSVYVFNWDVPKHIESLLDLVCGDDRYSFTPKNRVVIAAFLMTMQVYRRYYDTHFVSVFGENSKMNLSHYLIGLYHYPAAALAILCEAPIFAKSPSGLGHKPLELFDLPLSEKFAIIVFFLAWKHQHICSKILGNLRKNKNGEIVTSEYKLPTGDWFNYLTAPHQTTEIIMYFCIMWLMWNNITWFFVFAWVVVNQVETILLTHWWYQEKFEDFPKGRKALIPFVY